MTNRLRSFDIFDTAIFRKVFEPQDIFTLIEEEKGNNFKKKRIEAEKKASEKNHYYTLEEVYEFLPEFSIEDEINTEIANIYANNEILEEYNKDPENSIFVSDMYLTSDKLQRILEGVGYINPRIFVSCEMKAYKASGELFRKVEEKLNRQINVHYGDNYMADIVGAKEAGIPETHFKPSLSTHKLSLPAVKNSKLKKVLAILETEGNAEEQLVGHVAPMVSEFTKWVLSQRKEGQKIFFLSRDMIVPYRLATEVLEAKDVYYLNVSRKSLAPVIKKSKNKSLKEHFGTMNLEDLHSNKKSLEEIKNYLNKFDIKNGDIIADIGYSGTIQACIDDLFGIKTKGLYVQVNNKIEGINLEQFLNRSVLSYFLIVELPLGSSEDCVCGYKDGEPVFSPEHETRKKQAEHLTNLLFSYSSEFLNVHINVRDIEQTLIHLQFYPNSGLLDLFNQKIYSNKRIGESIIGFDRKEIMKGNLFNLYNNSYAKPLFRRMLSEDKELSYLEKLL